MCIVAESNVMLRAQAELPAGFKVATEKFLEGWGRMRSGGVVRLEKKVLVRGWNFLEVAECTVKSGVGATSEAAIAGALKLALRGVQAHSNAVEVEKIKLTQYPWFCLARIRVHQYRIQEGDALPAAIAFEAQTPARESRMPHRADEVLPNFPAALPMLKEMLLASTGSEVSAQ